MGFQNIGPNYWLGEEGRLALIKGTGKYTDQPYIDTWTELARWASFMPSGFEAVKYPDSQVLFTSGKAAIYPTGSWEISIFEKDATFELGVFKPPLPVAGDQCYISDHTDIALGMNAATKHPTEAKLFLDWVASKEFAELYSNALPGFFSLSNEFDHSEGSVSSGVLELARSVQVDHPQLVPNSLAWRAEPGERAVACQRGCHQRHADPRTGCPGNPGWPG